MGRRLDMAAHMEPDPDTARPRRPCRPVRDDLEEHRLLVGCAMDRRRAQNSDIIGVTEEPHQVVDEPVRRLTASFPVFHGNDHIEAPAWIGDPAFLLESSQSRLQRDVRALIGVHRLDPGERIAALGLEGFNEGGHRFEHRNILFIHFVCRN